MDVKEIDAEIQRLQAMKAEAMKAEEEKKAVERFEEAKTVLARLAKDCQRIYELGYCPPRILEALKDGNGKFNPGMYIKRPKGPREAKYEIETGTS